MILNPSRTLTLFDTQTLQVSTPSDYRHQYLTSLENMKWNTSKNRKDHTWYKRITTVPIPLSTKAKPKAILQSWKTFNLFSNMISFFFRALNTSYISVPSRPRALTKVKVKVRVNIWWDPSKGPKGRKSTGWPLKASPGAGVATMRRRQV